ncbi:hypothetical protein EVAR_59823_1 [Eumeta japonica]|uniref:Uncharacterized protein n=1 Tax=Eumeta variegata TaxID=151549 RepID=A0A4C1ZDN8_EUMVA|nr:hypothetical protein EVAR_59823_1 [Eumeta japonica]
MLRFIAPRPFLLLPPMPVLRRCAAFVTNFTAAEFRALYYIMKPSYLYQLRSRELSLLQRWPSAQNRYLCVKWYRPDRNSEYGPIGKRVFNSQRIQSFAQYVKDQTMSPRRSGRGHRCGDNGRWQLPISIGPRATLAEKEVTTLKEQLATTTPTPLQANIPPKTPNGNAHLEATVRDQGTDTRLERRFTDLRLNPVDISRISDKNSDLEHDRVDLDTPDTAREDIDQLEGQKMEMAATGRSNSNSSRSSPAVAAHGHNLESELAAKEKESVRAIIDLFSFLTTRGRFTSCSRHRPAVITRSEKDLCPELESEHITKIIRVTDIAHATNKLKMQHAGHNTRRTHEAKREKGSRMAITDYLHGIRRPLARWINDLDSGGRLLVSGGFMS